MYFRRQLVNKDSDWFLSKTEERRKHLVVSDEWSHRSSGRDAEELAPACALIKSQKVR